MATDRRAVRLGVLGLVGVLLFSLLGVRLWFIQTVQSSGLQEAVNRTRKRTVRIAPERGRIFDAEGRILADNQRILILGVDWQMLKRSAQRAELFSRLSGWVDVPVEEMEARWQKGGYSPFLPFPIKYDVDEATVAAILERVEDFPGVEITEGWKRVYPYAPHAAHVVGYMGSIQPGQVDEFVKQGYLLDERVGQFGVEGAMESTLHGTWGETVIEVDGANRPIRVISEIPPTNGKDIQLSIDLKLQQYVEQIVETTSIARRSSSAPNRERIMPNGTRQRQDPKLGPLVPYKSPAGSAVVMNYQTGHVMAMASYPTFDNRWFEAGISVEKFRQIFPITDEFGRKADPDKSILLNRAVQGRYNLGSTFKPFTAYAAMVTDLITPGYRYNDQGEYKLDQKSANRAACEAGYIKCIYKNAICGSTGKPCKYGSVNVADALAVSSDTFFYNLGEHIMLDNDKQPVLQEQLRNVGFGAKTGIELPFEFAGVVPDAAVKKEYALRGVITEDEGKGYYIADNVQLAIGQGLLSATPLQLVNGYATLANGGLVLQPTIVKTIFLPGVPDAPTPGYADIAAGKVLDPRPPIIKRQIPMPTAQRDAILYGLRRVIYGRGTGSGYSYHKTTGEEAFVNYRGIPLAGKTGTAQGFSSFSWNDSSVFAAFSTDTEHPYVMSAYMEKAGYGSQAALPVVKCTFEKLSDPTTLEKVTLSDPLDLNSTVAAPSMKLPANPACWTGKQGKSQVLNTTVQVD